MKIGLKTFDDERFLDYFVDKADFFEIMAIENKNYEFMKKYSIPVIIHAQHQKFGVNNADKNLNEKNKCSIEFAKKIADMTKSNKIVLHTGEILNSNCSLKTSLSFVRAINDNRICIENMPYEHNGIKRLCTIPEEIKEFTEKTKVKFCFDINHAIEAAIQLGKEPLQFINEFIKLNPAHYHLGGQNLKENKTHLDFENSDIDLDKIFKILPKDAEITLEVTQDIKKTEKDFEIIRKLVEKYGQ